MITDLEIGNIRVFEGTDWHFPMAPLTLFCGTNSAGKSTILKALMLLKQNLAAPESPGIPPGTLRLAGSQVDLGNFPSLVSHSDMRHKATLGITIEAPMSHWDVTWLRGTDQEDLFRGRSQEDQYSFSSRFVFGPEYATGRRTVMRESIAGAGQRRVAYGPSGILQSAACDVRAYGWDLLSWQIRSAGEEHEMRGKKAPRYDVVVPREHLKAFDPLDMMDLRSKDAGDEPFQEPVFMRGLTPEGILYPGHRGPRSSSRGRVRRASRFFVPYQTQTAYLDLQDALHRVCYLGPLRSPAKRYYFVRPDASPEMDPLGDFLPYVLPDSSKIAVTTCGPGLGSEAAKETFSCALNSWLQYLRTGHWIPINDSGSELEVSTTRSIVVEFMVKSVSGGEPHAPADSGFGYSQVLPILVRGLLAESGSTLIVEQPELHLNPALQVRLAEFFVAMVRCGKQVLIETHSEHIVNTVRVLAAEDESGVLARRSKIYYIEIPEGRVKPSVHEMSVGPNGTLAEWPYGFFGEAATLTGRLLRAQKRFLVPHCQEKR